MKQTIKEIELNHRAVDLYNIVLKIEEYPDYIPWCSKMEIIDRKKNIIKANMFVEYKFFSAQEFTSKVEYDEKKMIIKTSYIKGPLKDLNTKWEFIKINSLMSFSPIIGYLWGSF